MVVLDFDEPRVARHPLHTLTNLTVLQDLLDATKAAEYVDACVGWILDDAEHAAVGQMAPDELAVPDAAVGPLGKLQSLLGEALNDTVGAARLAKELKHQTQHSLHFLTGATLMRPALEQLRDTAYVGGFQKTLRSLARSACTQVRLSSAVGRRTQEARH